MTDSAKCGNSDDGQHTIIEDIAKRENADAYCIATAREILEAADVFYGDFGDGDDTQTLNQNDVWGWALSWGQHVPDDQLPVVAELFCRYGNGGILYWVSRQNDNMRSEFHDVNRHIEFVATEEAIRAKTTKDSKRAYEKITYTIGE